MSTKIIPQSFQDLHDDFIELEHIDNSYRDNLTNAVKKINKYKDILPEKSAIAILALQNEWIIKLGKFLKEINQLKMQSINHSSGLKLLLKLEQEKDENYYFLRSLSGVIGSLATATDWQSPSANYSVLSETGSQTGRISATINDYKRDWHLDAEGFEKAYLKEYIEAPLKFRLRALLTNSGMAAFTTVFNFLQMTQKIGNTVLLGRSSYFQYKQILKESLRKKVIEIDESKTEQIIKTVKESKPSAIFIDSLCNAKYIPVPDLPCIIDFLKKEYKEEIYLVIDNTGLSINFQPFKLIGLNRNVHLIVFESLMKYVHLGFDRVTGGIIIAGGFDGGKLFECRKHLGTNISDSSVYAFPKPSRPILNKRLLRHQRNASLLTSELKKYLKVIYPGQGSFFNLVFDKKHDNLRQYNRFIKTALQKAKKYNFQLVGGTSFGLNHTRIYLTSLWSKYGEPFLRVSAGTENLRQMEILKKILIETAISLRLSF